MDDYTLTLYGTQSLIPGPVILNEPNSINTISTAPYSGNITLNLKQGATSVIGQTTLEIAEGTHVENAVVGAGNDLIICNNAGDSISTSSTGNDTILGGSGNDTITPHSGNDVIHGGQGNNLIDGIFSGSDTIFGERGNDTISGGAGNNVYEFLGINGPTGHDVLNFNVTIGEVHDHDLIYFSSKFFATSQQALAAVTPLSGGLSAIIHLNDGGTITLNTDVKALTASDFVIVA